jgi:hypothetical protein
MPIPPIPFVPWLLSGSAAIVSFYGIKNFGKGLEDFREADRLMRHTLTRHDSAVRKLEIKRKDLNRQSQEYGKFLLSDARGTLERFVRFVERFGQEGSFGALPNLYEARVSAMQIPGYNRVFLEANDILKHAASIVACAAGANASVMAFVGLVGSASTGTAISSLSGAAAINATMAWLGGGSLASGGGGMAVGRFVLGGVTIAPAVLLGALAFGSKAKKELKDAEDRASEVSVETAKVDTLRLFLDSVIKRINELKRLANNLNSRAVRALRLVESISFDVNSEDDIKAFQQAALLVKALADVMKTPIVDEQGALTTESCSVQSRFRGIGE